MPKYEVLEKSFIDNHIVEAGTVVDFDGLPGRNLKPMDAEGEAKMVEAEKAAEKAMQELIANTRNLGQADPNDFATAVATAVASQMAHIVAELKAAEPDKPAGKKQPA
jgi:hypothetical protein